MILRTLFLTLVDLSMEAGWLICAVILLRFMLKSAPKWIRTLLWGAVGLRLMLPSTPHSSLSLLPKNNILQEQTARLLPAMSPVVPFTSAADNALTVPPMQSAPDIALIAAFIWAIGLAVMLGYFVLSWLLLYRRLRTSTPFDRGIRCSEWADTPFILGIFRPIIYLPYGLSEDRLHCVIAHEQAHLRRKDHLRKPAAFLLLAVYWFNPLVWAAYFLFSRDIELACDECVIRKMSREERQMYSVALVDCRGKRFIRPYCPVAFGEQNIRERVKNVMHYRRSAAWFTAIALLVSAVVVVCFATAPRENRPRQVGNAYTGVLFTDAGSDCEGVTLDLANASVRNQAQVLDIVWENASEDIVCSGQEYHVYRKEGDAWIDADHFADDRCWTLELLMQYPGRATRTYYLDDHDLTGAGSYRFEQKFHLNSDRDKEYTAWLEFTLPEMMGISVIGGNERDYTEILLMATTHFEDLALSLTVQSIRQDEMTVLAEHGGEKKTLTLDGKHNQNAAFSDGSTYLLQVTAMPRQPEPIILPDEPQNKEPSIRPAGASDDDDQTVIRLVGSTGGYTRTLREDGTVLFDYGNDHYSRQYRAMHRYMDIRLPSETGQTMTYPDGLTLFTAIDGPETFTITEARNTGSAILLTPAKTGYTFEPTMTLFDENGRQYNYIGVNRDSRLVFKENIDNHPIDSQLIFREPLYNTAVLYGYLLHSDSPGGHTLLTEETFVKQPAVEITIHDSYYVREFPEGLTLMTTPGGFPLTVRSLEEIEGQFWIFTDQTNRYILPDRITLTSAKRGTKTYTDVEAYFCLDGTIAYQLNKTNLFSLRNMGDDRITLQIDSGRLVTDFSRMYGESVDNLFYRTTLESGTHLTFYPEGKGLQTCLQYCTPVPRIFSPELPAEGESITYDTPLLLVHSVDSDHRLEAVSARRTEEGIFFTTLPTEGIFDVMMRVLTADGRLFTSLNPCGKNEYLLRPGSPANEKVGVVEFLADCGDLYRAGEPLCQIDGYWLSLPSYIPRESVPDLQETVSDTIYLKLPVPAKGETRYFPDGLTLFTSPEGKAFTITSVTNRGERIYLTTSNTDRFFDFSSFALSAYGYLYDRVMVQRDIDGTFTHILAAAADSADNRKKEAALQDHFGQYSDHSLSYGMAGGCRIYTD